MNLHVHACPLYALTKLVGLDFTADGLRLAPWLPVDSYRLESPLIGVVKTCEGYEGWYAPGVAGDWEIAISLPEKEVQGLVLAEVNGSPVHSTFSSGKAITLRGESAAGSPLRWRLRKNSKQGLR